MIARVRNTHVDSALGAANAAETAALPDPEETRHRMRKSMTTDPEIPCGCPGVRTRLGRRQRYDATGRGVLSADRPCRTFASSHPTTRPLAPRPRRLIPPTRAPLLVSGCFVTPTSATSGGRR